MQTIWTLDSSVSSEGKTRAKHSSGLGKHPEPEEEGRPAYLISSPSIELISLDGGDNSNSKDIDLK